MLEELKKEVWKANIKLVEYGLVIFTWGNVSQIDREKNLVVIKPSGIEYTNLKPEDMVVVDLLTGNVVEGKYKPSSDTLTHLEIYKTFPNIGGIAHTHSINAVAFAQAGLPIQALGTTQADYFCGDILCSRDLNPNEILTDYEKNTGKVIVETLKQANVDVSAIPAILVKNHGPFTWGSTAEEAVFNAKALETIAEMNLKTVILNPSAKMPKSILQKHYNRKHGKNAYYGQKV